MQSADVYKEQFAKRPGRLSGMLTRLLMKRATVVASDVLDDRSRLITLQGDGLKGIKWIPGQKIQIAMGSAFTARTYTPIEWDAVAGRTRIFGYAHADGPGSAWLLGVRPGDQCDIFGPRHSLDRRDLTGPLAHFGDETSIGLAYALIHRDSLQPVSCSLEVGSLEASRQNLGELGIDGGVRLFERRADDGHIVAMEECLSASVDDSIVFVLTGKAGTVQRLRQVLKRHDVPSSRIVTKAYWAPGKKGLD